MAAFISIKKVETDVTEPVTLAEAKTHLRVTFDDDDAEITALITRARQRVEDYCNNSIVAKTITAVFLIEPCYIGGILLPYEPVKSLTSLKKAAPDQTGIIGFTETDTFRYNYSLPDIYITRPGLYEAVYTAGFDTVPDSLKDTILAVIAFLYENRGQTGAQEDLYKVLSGADSFINYWI